MSQAHITALPERSFDPQDALSSDENPPRTFVTAIVLVLHFGG